MSYNDPKSGKRRQKGREAGQASGIWDTHKVEASRKTPPHPLPTGDSLRRKTKISQGSPWGHQRLCTPSWDLNRGGRDGKDHGTSRNRALPPTGGSCSGHVMRTAASIVMSLPGCGFVLLELLSESAGPLPRAQVPRPDAQDRKGRARGSSPSLPAPSTCSGQPNRCQGMAGLGRRSSFHN